MTAIQIAKANRFRSLHTPGAPFLLPNAWDAVTARLFAHIGYHAVATTSGGVAWSLGYADGEHAPFAEVLAVVRRIARAVDIPVTADLEGGYGQSADEVGQNVRAAIEAGAVGINLEDALHGTGKLRDIDDAAGRLRAARAVAKAAGVPIVINARVDTYLLKFGSTDDQRFNETVRRAKAYLAAGADCIFPIALSEGPRIQALAAAVGAPINVAAHPGLPPMPQLGKLGVARVSTATRLAMVALSAVERAARDIHQTGQFDSLEAPLPRQDVQRLMAD